MKYLTLIICLFTILLLSTGCSVIGLAVGANTESKEYYYKRIESNSPEFRSLELNKGDILFIFLTNGERLDGIFMQYESLSIDKYANEFKDAHSNSIHKKISVKVKEDIVSIPIDNIAQIAKLYKKNHALEGFLFGLGADILMVLLLNHMVNNFTFNLGG